MPRSTSFGIPGLLEVDVDDKGFSASTPVGRVRGDANGVTVGSNVGGVSVGRDGVRIDSPVGGVAVRPDGVTVDTPAGGVDIGSDGSVSVRPPGSSPRPGSGNAGDAGFPFPTFKLSAMEIPISVPRFTIQPLDIPLSAPRFSVEPLQLPLNVPAFGLPEAMPGWPFGALSSFPDVLMTPTPGGPVPIPYPNVAAAMAALGLLSGLGKVGSGVAPPGLPAPTPWLEAPAPWVAQVCRAVAATVAMWKFATHVQGGTLNSCVGILPPGTLRSDVDFEATLKSRLSVEGVPGGLAKAVAKTLAAAWDGWFGKFTGSLLFPAFVAYPAPIAPPMPNVPVPLVAAGVSSGWSAMTPVALEQAFLAAPGIPKSADTERAARQVSRWFADRYARFCTMNIVTLVMGDGPVPTFAPPAVPAGPVVGGKMSSGRGILVGADVFSEMLPVG